LSKAELTKAKNLREGIHEANVNVFKFEAKFYELIHDEVYGRYEQKRIFTTLGRIDKLILRNQKKALDFGAGTGNITGKLLKMGYTVTAIDISPDMCAIMKTQFKNYLEKGMLEVINSPIEDAYFDEQKFDLIACYSVLHHLPDYENVIHVLSKYLKKGGIMYLDHEGPTYNRKPIAIDRFVRFFHFRTNWLINKLFLKVKGFTIPSAEHIDYKLSDYWAFDEHPIDFDKIGQILQKKYTRVDRIDYHLNRSWIFSPTFYLYNILCRPDKSLWIARK
jgi:2-polyprenyl-3-methyl-5-hydroxy-6-metoxy-1,4-benzoquinol methylase